MVTFWTPGASPKDPLNPCLPVSKPVPPSLPVFTQFLPSLLRNRSSLKKKCTIAPTQNWKKLVRTDFREILRFGKKLNFFRFFEKFCSFSLILSEMKNQVVFFLTGIEVMQG